MTPRERVETTLRGDRADCVPFTVYEELMPKGQVGQALRNDGACVISRQTPFTTRIRDVEVEQQQSEAAGVRHVRTTYRTPKGTLATEARSVPGSAETYCTEPLFKSPKDYAALDFLLGNREYEHRYDAIRQSQDSLGDGGLVVADIGYSPMQDLMQSVMGVERFSEEWSLRRDDVIQLYETLVDDRRKRYAVAAEAPVLAVNYCGNVSAEVVGLERFEQYYLPHYDECADTMHAAGKVVGVHFDANTWGLSDLIGVCRIDYVEALTPRPDGDTTVAEARTEWHDKVLWVNFPYSLHAAAPDEVELAACQLMWEAAPGDRFVVGITEAVPKDSWQESFPAILRAVNRDGRLPITWRIRSQRITGN